MGAFLLAKSDGALTRPDKWLILSWYLLTTDKNVVTRGLAENSPRHNFWNPSTHGLLSVNTLVFDCDWIMNGLKCLMLAAIERTSISQGNQDTWCLRSFALKNSFPSQFTYKVAPIPCFVTDPSVTIHNWSLCLGSVTDLRDLRDFWELIDWIVFYAISAIVHPYNGGIQF